MPELRYEQVTKTWVIIATERAKRPSDFAFTNQPQKKSQGCPFCPGNESKTPPEVMAYRQKTTEPDSPGWQVRVVPNKFPALDPGKTATPLRRGFFNSIDGAGAHEVILETPDHNRHWAEQSPSEIMTALSAWQERYVALSHDERLHYTQIFKNHGAIAGASLEHPHSQLISTPMVPIREKGKLHNAADYFDEHSSCYYCDTIEAEEKEKERLIYQDERVSAYCPFASRFPMEVLFAPRNHQDSFSLATTADLSALAKALSCVCRRLAEGAHDPPFNLILHTSPYRDHNYRTSFHWHLKLLPRLTLIAGFELGSGMYINPTPPEMAAGFYRKE